jgi:hypothetical protein
MGFCHPLESFLFKRFFFVCLGLMAKAKRSFGTVGQTEMFAAKSIIHEKCNANLPESLSAAFLAPD